MYDQREGSDRRSDDRRDFSDRRMKEIPVASDRRSGSDRRASDDRRFTDRRDGITVLVDY